MGRASVCMVLLLGGCASHSPSVSPARDMAPTPPPRKDIPKEVSARRQEVVLFAMSLIDTDYRFGGKNPEAGLDCSGMVAYVFREAIGVEVKGSAADIANRGRPVIRKNLREGDLLFFNTSGKPYSHVGIYIGQGRFIHAPASKGKVRIDELGSEYFAKRYQEARTLFPA
ncbi:C40 family peptidase [Burkholderiaceae bacterium DAT-1]|nr:C40 family peptidase [Burkholderiaceae bacterium DAT-1]